MELINDSQGFYKYFIEKDEVRFILSVYYTKKKGTTILASCEHGKELEQIIVNAVEYKDVRSGSFSAQMSKEFFNSIIDLLGTLPNINVTEPDDKGQNGIIIKISTDFGDSATLTYFTSKSKMLYQGLFMKLYAIIKSYLLTLQNNISETEFNEPTLDVKVQQHINTNFPNGWNLLEPVLKGLIKDSFSLVEEKRELSDYAACVMPIIRVLEYRIKKVCLDYGININDKKGFRYINDSSNPDSTRPIFIVRDDIVESVNTEITSMPEEAKETIIQCYDFLRKNRHEMFHATQILLGMKLVGTKDEALNMIIETSARIEESLTIKIA